MSPEISEDLWRWWFYLRRNLKVACLLKSIHGGSHFIYGDRQKMIASQNAFTEAGILRCPSLKTAHNIGRRSKNPSPQSI